MSWVYPFHFFAHRKFSTRIIFLALMTLTILVILQDISHLPLSLSKTLLAYRAALVAQPIKNLPASAGEVRDVCSIPGSGRSPGGGHGNPLQYSCLENPIDRGAWWALAHRVAKRQN